MKKALIIGGVVVALGVGVGIYFYMRNNNKGAKKTKINLAVSEMYSNASSDVGAIAEAVGQVAKLKAEVTKKRAERDAMMAESGCKKPDININIGKKKKEYLKCIQNFNQTNASAKEADRQLRLTEAKLKSAVEMAKLAPKKFLGMPQGLGFAVAGLGSAVLILGSLYIYKKHIANERKV